MLSTWMSWTNHIHPPIHPGVWTPPTLSSESAWWQQKQALNQPYKHARNASYRPIHWEKGKLEAQARNGYHTLVPCLPFHNTHRLWPIAFLNLEAVGKIRLGKSDSPAGSSVLRGSVVHHSSSLQMVMQPSEAESSELSHMSGELTCSFIVHKPQLRMV